MSTHLEGAIQAAARQLALGIVARLRAASVEELLALAEKRPLVRVAYDGGDGRRAPGHEVNERNPAVGSARIRQAVRELSAEAALSPVESEVLGRAAQAETRDEIAKNMGVSVNTTKLRIRRVLGKIGGESLTDLAAHVLHRAVSYR